METSALPMKGLKFLHILGACYTGYQYIHGHFRGPVTEVFDIVNVIVPMTSVCDSGCDVCEGIHFDIPS